jgi:leucyl-tRNA synthetase
MAIDYHAIEAKWQEAWAAEGLFHSRLDSPEKKLYTLVMFSYPSSAKLHVGHWFNYAPTDTWARFKRMQGHNIFMPMGFDSFGLPAENYAIKTNIHPQQTTDENIAVIREQIKRIGAMYDWRHELRTSAPDYYRWTQWLFLQLYKHKLAYRAKAPVNWCPSCSTVLANEQVVEGQCERCDSVVERRHLTQWFFKSTAYAQELLDGLESIDWPEKTKAMQRNWIGRSEGARVRFSIVDQKAEFDVFTTRPDTLWGVTYMVLAPEHALVEEVTSAGQRAAVETYIAETRKLSETERLSTVKEKTGVFTGAYARNPVNGEQCPIWIADYVLASYGFGAVMAVPGHDERDFDFARKYDLPIRKVIQAPQTAARDALTEAYTGSGTMLNSGDFSGMDSRAALPQVIAFLEKNACGEGMVNYRLRDWSVSRQRYWGAPIPIVYCPACGELPVPESELPVLLPADVDFKPTGESPLATHADFLATSCPACHGPARREADTMDTFVDSAWYFMRYLNANDTQQAIDRRLVKEWLPVDKYVGGAEHAVMHLLYARFITKAMRDMGIIDIDEPFASLVHQGVILGPDGNRMSKSRGNVINPDAMIERYGADVLRGYLMFGFAYIEGGPWNDSGIAAIDRFYNRIWRLLEKYQWSLANLQEDAVASAAEAELQRVRHQSIKGVSEDTERFQFNTSLSRIMELVNALYKYSEDRNDADVNAQFIALVLRDLLKLLAPFAPHLAQELWSRCGLQPAFVVDAPWPQYDAAVLIAQQVEIVIQINGKIRERMQVTKDLDQDSLVASARQYGRMPELLQGKTERKVIAISNKLVNIVAS